MRARGPLHRGPPPARGHDVHNAARCGASGAVRASKRGACTAVHIGCRAPPSTASLMPDPDLPARVARARRAVCGAPSVRRNSNDATPTDLSAQPRGGGWGRLFGCFRSVRP